MTQPVIGITVHVGRLPRKDGTTEWAFLLHSRYPQAVTAAGGVPVLLPTLEEAAAPVESVLDAIDGLLLSGGGSIPGQLPATQRREPTLREVNPERYDLERELVRAAWQRGMPLLGVCRGHQTIAETLGGRILDLSPDRGHRSHRQALPPTESLHPLETVPGTRVAGWLGGSTTVNSFHRQVVDEPPEGWTVAARSDDGWVEAIETTGSDRFGVGTQFHPEWLAQGRPEFQRIFDAFVAAAAAYRGQRTRVAPTA